MAQALTIGQAAPEPSGRGAVLVVEDDIFIRMDLAEALRAEGYAVLEAVNGDEALALLDSGVACRLVVSDMQMPGRTDGRALAAHLKTERPDLPVVLASGSCAAETVEAAGFVAKPYDPSQVVALVARLTG